jgi:3-keto-5-aminohexanoate cleavage enzyme
MPPCMIGARAILRVRMSAHDTHYAGELVDGARILALFGDVATELLIRLDGDEGLFRAYESVEFLSPVRAGDYLEVTAELTAIGKTSRTIRFEAAKVISNVRAAGAPPSAADVLLEPVLAARAVGTCVVPGALQRKPHGRHGDVIITAAIVGAELTRAHTPHLPITPREVAREAARCRAAGAAIIHLHARNDDGSNTQSSDRFAEVIEAIHRECDCIVQPSTGGAVGMSVEERAGPLACRPEMATLNCGTINFGDDVFVNSRPDIRKLAAKIRAAGSVPELECYEAGHVEEALALAAEGAISKPLHFQFVLGIKGAIGARETVVTFLRSLIPADATWAVAAVGRHQQPMTELAMRLGGHVRVGLEDNIYLERGALSEGSAPLVARAAGYARSVGREPVDPARAREMLGIVGR